MRRLLLLGLLALVAAPGAQAAERARFDVRVLTRIPDPGFVALTVLGPDRTIYGGTFFPAAGNEGDGVPSKVFAWTPDGKLKREYVITGQDLSGNHGVQTTVVDAAGRVLLLDTSPPRLLRLDPATGEQVTLARFPELAPCAAGQDPRATPCSRTLNDGAAQPNYAAWGPDGALYVSDAGQATIFRLPPGGGAPEVWLSDASFDVGAFSLTGLALTPDRRSVAVTVVGANPTSDLQPSRGRLVEVPILPDGSAGPLRTVWTSGSLDVPDGFAYGTSGTAYVALLGPGINQVAAVAPDGAEVARFPSAAQNAAQEVPFDGPSSVIFDGDRLIVTNDAFFSGDRSKQVLFDVAAGEAGVPPFVPGRPTTTPAPAARGRIELTVTPRTIRSGRRVTLRIRGRVRTGARTVPVPAGTVVRAAAARARFGAGGRARVTLTPRRARVLHVRVALPGARSARVPVRIRRAAR